MDSVIFDLFDSEESNSNNETKLCSQTPEFSLNQTDAAIKARYPTAQDKYCFCERKSSDEGDIMIQCEYCEIWFHLQCVNLTTRLIADIETYACSTCKTEEKQIIYKKRHNAHRHDYSDQNAAKKPTQAGTQAFIQNLLNRQFPDAYENEVVIKLEDGAMLTHEFFEKNGFERPILIENKSGLGFTMPSSEEINLTQIQNIVGGEYLLDVIDVERQEVFPMNINELNAYFQTEPRSKVYNLISFEISNTKLTEDITAPRIVHEISWVSNGVWPEAEQTQINSSADNIVKPEVQKYCLISAGKSYTDFHVDFGGSSVWYHVVKGDKIFYLIEPNDENLKIYENWNCLKNHSEIFLGDQVKNCYKFELRAGNTIFLPTGWIHAVYTPNDSLVFGGNFLQSLNIPLQLKIYEMELRLKTPEKYRFPAFETLQWYAAKYYTQKLKELNSSRKCIDLKLFFGLKYLNNALRKWINGKDYYQTHDYEIPKNINCDKLVVIMSKELNKAELLLKANGIYKALKTTRSYNMKSQQQAIIGDDKKNSLMIQKQNKKSPKQKEILSYENMNFLEIKLDSNECEAASFLNEIESKVENIDDLINKSANSGDDSDDAIIKDLKNSYQDTQYVYPSLSNSKSLKSESSCSQSDEQQGFKSSRKRKLKPHAVHYLQPKQVTKELDDDISRNNKKNEDDDYVNHDSEDEDEDSEAIVDDNDEDFKLKCKNNLKLSKKLKKNLMKQQKKEAGEGGFEGGSSSDQDIKNTSGFAPSAIASKNCSKNKQQKEKDQQQNYNSKKVKKGFATTKQRLGKLLKLNRYVNF